MTWISVHGRRKRVASQRLSTELTDDLDTGAVSGGSCERAIPCNERGVERFGKSDVSRIVRCQITAESPDSKEEEVVRVTVYCQISEIFERLLAPLRVHFARMGVTAQNLSNLEIDHMRGMQRVVAGKQSLGYFPGRGCVEQHFQKGGGVDDDHWRSRSTRTALAGGIRGVTDSRCAKRCRKSLSVGRSARCSTSWSR